MFQYSHWLDLPIQTRMKIASIFGIVKRGSTEVFNNTIKNDGYVIKEIEAGLSKKALQDYVDEPTENDLVVLWNLMLNKVNGIPKVKKDELPVIVETTIKNEPTLSDSVVVTKPKKTSKKK